MLWKTRKQRLGSKPTWLLVAELAKPRFHSLQNSATGWGLRTQNIRLWGTFQNQTLEYKLCMPPSQCPDNTRQPLLCTFQRTQSWWKEPDGHSSLPGYDRLVACFSYCTIMEFSLILRSVPLISVVWLTEWRHLLERTRCIRYFSIAVRKHSISLKKEEFMLPYGSGGVESITVFMAWLGGRSEKLTGHIFIHTQKGGRRGREWRKWGTGGRVSLPPVICFL